MTAPGLRRGNGFDRLDRLLLAVLMAAYIASGISGGSGYDTARDVAEAFAIRRQESWPLHGPLFAGALYLGPVWFYVLAIPLVVHESWLSLALFAQMLGSFQFPLAYAAGRRLLDRRFGLLWSAMLALPGWGSFELIGFGHANMVRVCAMLVLYALVRLVQDRRPAWLLLASGGLALAVHAHPSTAGFGLVVMAVALFALRDLRSLIGWGTASLAIAALPFAPLLLGPGGALDHTGDTIASLAGFDNLRNLPALMYAILVRGPRVIADAFLAWTPGLALLLQALIVGIEIVAALGLIAALRAHRGLTIATLATAAVVMATVAWMRPGTTFYMTYAMLPPLAALGALGLYGLARLAGAHAAAISSALAAGIVALHLATVGGIARAIGSGSVVMPSITRLDIKQDDPAPALPEPWLPAYAVDESGRRLCGETRPIALHGTYAYLENSYFGLDHRLHCGPRDITLLGGSPSASHLVGLAAPLWAALGWRPATFIGGIGIAPAARVVGPESGFAVADGRVYPPYRTPAGPSRTVVLESATRGSEALVVSMPWHIWMPPPAVKVSANGDPLPPLARDAISSAYTCRRCTPEDRVTWRIELESPAPEWIDVVTVDRR